MASCDRGSGPKQARSPMHSQARRTLIRSASRSEQRARQARLRTRAAGGIGGDAQTAFVRLQLMQCQRQTEPGAAALAPGGVTGLAQVFARRVADAAAVVDEVDHDGIVIVSHVDAYA